MVATVAAPEINDSEDDADYRILMRRPGFLIRRLHQMHLALLDEECAAFGATPIQYSIMTAIEAFPAEERAAFVRSLTKLVKAAAKTFPASGVRSWQTKQAG